MSRHILSLAHEPLAAFDFDAFVTHADALNQRHCEAFTTSFPKAPRRWLSHYTFTPRPIALSKANCCPFNAGNMLYAVFPTGAHIYTGNSGSAQEHCTLQ
jgi:hypothetical protein